MIMNPSMTSMENVSCASFPEFVDSDENLANDGLDEDRSDHLDDQTEREIEYQQDDHFETPDEEEEINVTIVDNQHVVEPTSADDNEDIVEEARTGDDQVAIENVSVEPNVAIDEGQHSDEVSDEVVKDIVVPETQENNGDGAENDKHDTPVGDDIVEHDDNDADESAVEQEPRRSSREIRAPQRYGFRVETAMKTMPSVGKQVLLDPEAYVKDEHLSSI